MRREYTISISVGDFELNRHGIIKIVNTGGKQVVQFIGDGFLYTADEMALASIINQMLARITNGKMVDYVADLPSFASEEEVIKCEWLESGNLKLHGPTDKHYHYVDNLEDALLERRKFTCPRRLLVQLPKHKEPQHVSSIPLPHR